METLQLQIMTPTGAIYDGEALSVTIPGEEGEFGVLPNHASLATILQAGVVDIETTDKTVESVVVNWGVVQVDEKKVLLLVDGAIALKGDSESEIAKAIEDAKSLVDSASDSSAAIATVSAKIESSAQKLF
ncbi:MAG: ATP synthase F1 subunit epsilon [Campylobacterota bacterium]|nr:ATP synthase F1 subunit epsilon [Campylobacterota bacterium]